jgi:hypothetical protein
MKWTNLEQVDEQSLLSVHQLGRRQEVDQQLLLGDGQRKLKNSILKRNDEN